MKTESCTVRHSATPHGGRSLWLLIRRDGQRQTAKVLVRMAGLGCRVSGTRLQLTFLPPYSPWSACASTQRKQPLQVCSAHSPVLPSSSPQRPGSHSRAQHVPGRLLGDSNPGCHVKIQRLMSSPCLLHPRANLTSVFKTLQKEILVLLPRFTTLRSDSPSLRVTGMLLSVLSQSLTVPSAGIEEGGKGTTLLFR